MTGRRLALLALLLVPATVTCTQILGLESPSPLDKPVPPDASVPCADGSCPCPAGQTSCNGACVDVSRDPASCGACGRLCSDVHAKSAKCVAGACQITCESEYKDCDHDPSNGCESPQLDSANCGACGRDCLGGACTLDFDGTPTCRPVLYVTMPQGRRVADMLVVNGTLVFTSFNGVYAVRGGVPRLLAIGATGALAAKGGRVFWTANSAAYSADLDADAGADAGAECEWQEPGSQMNGVTPAADRILFAGRTASAPVSVVFSKPYGAGCDAGGAGVVHAGIAVPPTVAPDDAGLTIAQGTSTALGPDGTFFAGWDLRTNANNTNDWRGVLGYVQNGGAVAVLDSSNTTIPRGKIVAEGDYVYWLRGRSYLYYSFPTDTAPFSLVRTARSCPDAGACSTVLRTESAIFTGLAVDEKYIYTAVARGVQGSLLRIDKSNVGVLASSTDLLGGSGPVAVDTNVIYWALDESIYRIAK